MRPSAGDTSLLVELATGYSRIGDVQGGLGLPNLGDSASALASYAKGRDILRAVLAGNPANPDVRRRLARVYNQIVGVRMILRNSAEARASAQEALTTLQPLPPADEESQLVLVEADSRMASVLAFDNARIETLAPGRRAPDASRRVDNLPRMWLPNILRQHYQFGAHSALPGVEE